MTGANSAPDDAPLFTAVLKPHRSLGAAGFFVLMAVLIFLSAIGGIVFWTIGAWPVPGFLGLDVVLVYLAFRLSYRRGAAAEEIGLTRSALTVRHVAPDGTAAETTMNPYWVQLEVERHPEFGIMRAALAWSDRRLPIGRFLGPREREAFCREFGAALTRVRNAPGAA
jgi:uncharacterized membrane protein